jgi:LuxR family maltose regulon positive regulatory protein
MLLDAVDESESLLGATVRAADALGCPETSMIALGQLSLIARERGDADQADELAADAQARASAYELDSYPTYAIVLAAAAQASLRNGRWADARELVAEALPIRRELNEALPWLAVHARLDLARCSVRLRDRELAQALVGEANAVLAMRPRLGVLVDRVRLVELEAAALPEVGAMPTGLTPAELRLLPLLATHLSFREIADDLHVSRNTVKTQAISIYRKLGVSGRSEAIAAAAALHGPDAA